MKRFILFVFAFLFLVSGSITAKEYYFRFQIEQPSELDQLTRMISIDNVVKDTVYAYANEREWKEFTALGYQYELLPHPGSLYDHAMSNSPKGMKDWNTYPTYDAYVQMMQQFAANYPDICVLDTFGYSVQGRLLLTLKISDNVHVEENEPEFFYTSTMHGDETVGYVLLLRLADYLLTNYGDTLTAEGRRVTHLVDNMEIWINPLFNPDGTYAGGNNTVNYATRYNANGADLNRNFPDRITNPINTPAGREPETQAMMALAAAQNFVLSANFHGGAQVVNYPWDNGQPSGVYSMCPDDAWFIKVSRTYATPNPDIMNGGFPNGITNGCAWYAINGGRQDWMYYFEGGREVTIELYNTKNPPGTVLPQRWINNKESFLAYMEEAFRGIRGIVTDAETGQPLAARIDVVGIPDAPVFSDPDVGDFYRLLLPGTYSIIVSANHYQSDTLTNITVVDSPATVVNVQLHPQQRACLAGYIFLADTTNYQGTCVTVENQSVYTTNDGFFEMPGIFAGPVEIRISHPGYTLKTVHATVAGEDTLWIEEVLYPTSGSILVINDDSGKRLLPGSNHNKSDGISLTSKSTNSSAQVFSGALQNAGYQVVVETSAQTNSSHWSDYPFIIWSSGANTSPISSSVMRTSLLNYVNNGGKLIIEGGEIGYDFRNDYQFKSQVLHIQNWVTDDAGNLVVHISSHPITQNLPATISLSYSSYGDQDAVTPATGTELLIHNQNQTNTAGALLSGDVLFLAFNIAAIPQNVGEQLVRNAAGFFYPLPEIQNDLAVMNLSEDLAGTLVSADSTVSFAVIVKNYGTQTQPAGKNISLEIRNGSQSTLMQTTIPDSIASMDTLLVPMGTWTVPDTTCVWTIQVKLDTTGDEILSNNRAIYKLLSYSSQAQIAEDFEEEPQGWQVVSADTQTTEYQWHGVTWPVEFGHFAAGVYPRTSGASQNEWLITPALDHPEQLSFFWDYGADHVTGNTILLLGSATDSLPGSFTDTLLVFQDGDTLPGNGYQRWVHVPLSETTRFVAFVYQGLNGKYLVLDNVVVKQGEVSGIELSASTLPQTFALEQNYPNPFNPSTTIRYALPHTARVVLRIYNVLGQNVATPVNTVKGPGYHSVTWQPEHLGSGIYFYELKIMDSSSGNVLYQKMRKMLLVK